MSAMASPARITPPAPFDALAETYDEVFTNSWIGRAQRASVWQELEKTFRPGQRVLELNCGTGVDAAFLAGRGTEVVACDPSSAMLRVARRRAAASALRAPVTFHLLSSEEIATLQGQAPFDGAFSNFAGLNCVEDLARIARDLARLLNPGAPSLACLAGSFVPWEMVWYLRRGSVRKAFRRFARGRVQVRIAENITVHCRYPSVREIARCFAPYFRLAWWKGVGIAVPPTYYESFVRRHPKFFDALRKVEPRLSRLPLIRGCADHVLISFERTTA